MKKLNLPEKDGRLSSEYDPRYSYVLNMTQGEIAKQLGVSRQAISQMEQRALNKFKTTFCNMFPDTWRLIQEDIEKGWFGHEI